MSSLAGTEHRSGGSPSARWLLGITVLFVALIGAAAFAVPVLITTDTLRLALEEEISAITGHEVILGETTAVRYLPTPEVSVDGIRILDSGNGESPILSADRLTADFGLMSALTGRGQFANFHLENPDVLLEIFADGTTGWASERGHVAESAALMAENAQTRREGSGQAEASAIPMTPLGVVTLSNGTLRVVDHIHDSEETLTAVNGSLSWPRIGMGARLDMSGVLRDETIKIVASSERPAELLAGTPTPLRFNLTSDLLSLNYSGTIAFTGTAMLDGDIRLSSPSARSALRWSGAEIKPGEAIGALDLEAQLQGGARQIRLNELLLDIDDNRGIGALDIAWPENGLPSVSGTLAYNALDVGAFLEAFTPLPGEGDDIATIDTGFLRQLALDLRLSAQTAQIGPVALGNLAAAARIEEGRAVFDIGDATAYGGNVIGRVVISEHGFDGGGELQLSLQEADFGQLYDAVGIAGPLPRGTGTMNLSISSPNPIWATTLRDLTGSLDLTMQQGVIPRLNLGRFRELSASERFFPLDRASDGELAFRSARFAASIANGTAEVTTAEILTENATIILSGLIPYDRGSLAMSGAITGALPETVPGQDATSVLQPTQPAPNAGSVPLRFFIGGSWPTPVISPIRQD